MSEYAAEQEEMENLSGADLADVYFFEQQAIAGRISATTTRTGANMNKDLNSLSFSQLVPKVSNYLSKEDVGEDGVILTIKGFKSETVKGDNGDEEKIVMHFVEEGYKPMILNNTNSNILGKITGAQNAGEARGKQVVVYDDPTVGFGGKITGGIRLKKVSGQASAPRQASKPADDLEPF